MRKTTRTNFRQVLAAGLTCAMAMTAVFSDVFAGGADYGKGVYASTVDEELTGEHTNTGYASYSSVTTEDAVKIASLHNPVSDELNETIEYSYVYFGEYPQHEVTGSALTGGITGAAFDVYGDAVVGDEKYCRVKTENGMYRYFKYEPIRWRVICKEGNEAILRSDLVLDCQIYSDDVMDSQSYSVWKYTFLRRWLNGLDDNMTGFQNRAFTDGELNAINAKLYGEDRDKVFMLSGAELNGLGGLDKPFELITKASDFALKDELKRDEKIGTACWWVRNNDEYNMNEFAGYVDEYGVRYNAVEGTKNEDRPAVFQHSAYIGVCPSIVLDLEQTKLWCTEKEMQAGIMPDRRENDVYKEFGKLGDNVYYYIRDKVMFVCGNGKTYDFCNSQDTYQRRNQIEKIIINDGITQIGKYAFWNLNILKEVVIADSVQSIGNYAFSWCQNLEKITMAATLTDFQKNAFEYTKWYSDLCEESNMVICNGVLMDMNQCEGVVTIPRQVTRITQDALMGPWRLTRLIIPETVLNIEEDAFVSKFFLSDIGKFCVAKNSVAEKYFRSHYKEGGYYVIQEDGTFVKAGAATTEPNPTECVVESQRPSEQINPTEAPVITGSSKASDKPEETRNPVTPDAVMTGDVNGDKQVTLEDAQMVLKAALKINNLTENQRKAADVDFDELITLKDAQIILKVALKIIAIDSIKAAKDEDVDVMDYTVEEIADIIAKQTAWEPFEKQIPDLEFEMINPPEPSETEIYPLKPVIYLYPEETTEIEAELDFNGDFTFTWPDYRDGWKVIAEPDGRLTDTYDGSEHYYLFWEGRSNVAYEFDKGFCVKGEDTAAFLKEALSMQGLTPREYNDFITFWVPRMQENKYNVISFLGDVYTDNARLSFSIKPDTMKRVFMAWYGSDEPVEIDKQELTGFERTGFTVVEWGGAQVAPDSYKK